MRVVLFCIVKLSLISLLLYPRYEQYCFTKRLRIQDYLSRFRFILTGINQTIISKAIHAGDTAEDYISKGSLGKIVSEEIQIVTSISHLIDHSIVG